MAILVLGGISITSGLSVLRYDIRCHSAGCDQPNEMTVGLIVWGGVALLTAFPGRVGLFALILVLVSPLAIGWLHPWFFVLGLLALLSIAKGSKEQLAPYYRWKKEEQ
jgi:hypothetical protein